ncbi:Gp49 family protein [Paracidovorax citrulli]|uniref:Gp49 family protein n=1 Tax=Paracidovorax citrulli TaxID=80869 RepID=UPI003A80D205
MNNSFIRPTIGRRVWFRPSAAYLASNPTMTQLNPEQAMDAGIVYVHHDHMVNLQVADHVGRQFLVTSVPLLAGAWEAGDDLYFAALWMPYQREQVTKNQGAATGAPSVEAAAEAIMHSAGYLRAGPQGPITLQVSDPGPDSLERDIQARASVAPRVTPDDIKAEIVGEHFFTAADGVQGAYRAGNDVHPVGGTPSEAAHRTLGLLTFCVLRLKNGFTVTGESACASPENFNAEIGRRIAKENAVAKIWPLLGFRLRDKLQTRSGCQGERCMSTDGSGHSRECIAEAGRSQGWTPTAEELAAAGPSAPDSADFALGKACDLSGEGGCEACQ